MAERLLRVHEIAGDRAKGKDGILPIGVSTWWLWVKQGRAPQPVRLGRVTCWRESEVMALLGGEG